MNTQITRTTNKKRKREFPSLFKNKVIVFIYSVKTYVLFTIYVKQYINIVCICIYTQLNNNRIIDNNSLNHEFKFETENDSSILDSNNNIPNKDINNISNKKRKMNGTKYDNIIDNSNNNDNSNRIIKKEKNIPKPPSMMNNNNKNNNNNNKSKVIDNGLTPETLKKLKIFVCICICYYIYIN